MHVVSWGVQCNFHCGHISKMLEAAESVWLHGALFTSCLVIVLKLWPMRCQGRSGGKDRVWEKILHSKYGAPWSYCPFFHWILLYLYVLSRTVVPSCNHKGSSYEIMLNRAKWKEDGGNLSLRFTVEL